MVNFFKKYMGLIGSIGQLLFYFQAFSIFQHKSAADVSLIGFGISLVSLSCWLIYGFLIKDKALVSANAVGLTGAFCVVVGIILYS